MSARLDTQAKSAMASGRVVPTGVPRMAAADSFGRSPHAADRAVFLDRLNCVLTASRSESTTRSNQRADSDLVNSDELDQERLDQPTQHRMNPSSVKCIAVRSTVNRICSSVCSLVKKKRNRAADSSTAGYKIG